MMRSLGRMGDINYLKNRCISVMYAVDSCKYLVKMSSSDSAGLYMHRVYNHRSQESEVLLFSRNYFVSLGVTQGFLGVTQRFLKR